MDAFCEAAVSAVKERLPGRAAQINGLLQMFGQPGDWTLPGNPLHPRAAAANLLLSPHPISS